MADGCDEMTPKNATQQIRKMLAKAEANVIYFTEKVKRISAGPQHLDYLKNIILPQEVEKLKAWKLRAEALTVALEALK